MSIRCDNVNKALGTMFGRKRFSLGIISSSSNVVTNTWRASRELQNFTVKMLNTLCLREDREDLGKFVNGACV